MWKRFNNYSCITVHKKKSPRCKTRLCCCALRSVAALVMTRSTWPLTLSLLAQLLPFVSARRNTATYSQLQAIGNDYYNYTSDSYQMSAYLRSFYASYAPPTVQVAIKVKKIYRIDTVQNTIQLSVRVISMWNDSTLACGPVDSAELDCGYSYKCCLRSEGTPSVVNISRRSFTQQPCSVHPAKTSPRY